MGLVNVKPNPNIAISTSEMLVLTMTNAVDAC